MADKKPTAHHHHIDPALMSGESPFRHCLLVATPSLSDGFFSRSVIYLCAHSTAGAMGIVINQRLPDVVFSDLFKQLKLPSSELIVEPVVHFGGPVETGRGFVLHTADYMRNDTVRINDSFCMTGTTDILRAIAAGKGPGRAIFALGYAGWGPGQLEAEMQENSWICIPPEREPVFSDIIFSPDLAGKWEKALSLLGIAPATFSFDAGHA